MCRDCGCGDKEIVPVEVHQRILSENDAHARHNREHFEEHGVVSINLMGSPGSGKTALLEATSRLAGSRLRFSAVSGDLATDRDGERLRRAGIPASTITTGSACHLDARMVHDALHDLPLEGLDAFFIENVGNLVCPAIYDLGQTASVVALSVTEGEDKPLKYPHMFRAADLMLLNKIDLLPHVRFDTARCVADARLANPRLGVVEVSATRGDGLVGWYEWLRERVAALDVPAGGAGLSGPRTAARSHT